MARTASSPEAILKALPAVQAAVREEIAARIAAGEAIAGIDAALEAKLAKRKRELLGAVVSDTVPSTRTRPRKARRSAA